MPPVACGPHSSTWPTRLPAASRSKIALVPFELVHQHAERQRAVGAAAGDDDVRPGIERRADRQGTEICIRRQQFRTISRFALDPQQARMRKHVVALDNGDLRRKPLFRGWPRKWHRDMPPD